MRRLLEILVLVIEKEGDNPFPSKRRSPIYWTAELQRFFKLFLKKIYDSKSSCGIFVRALKRTREFRCMKGTRIILSGYQEMLENYGNRFNKQSKIFKGLRISCSSTCIKKKCCKLDKKNLKNV